MLQSTAYSRRQQVKTIVKTHRFRAGPHTAASISQIERARKLVAGQFPGEIFGPHHVNRRPWASHTVGLRWDFGVRHDFIPRPDALTFRLANLAGDSRGRVTERADCVCEWGELAALCALLLWMHKGLWLQLTHLALARSPQTLFCRQPRG